MGSGSSKTEETERNKTNNSGGQKDKGVPVQSVTPVPPKDETIPSGKNIDGQDRSKQSDLKQINTNEPKHNEQKEDNAKSESEKPVAQVIKEVQHVAGQTTGEAVIEEVLIDEGPKEQLKFDCALKSACLLVNNLHDYIIINTSSISFSYCL